MTIRLRVEWFFCGSKWLIIKAVAWNRPDAMIGHIKSYFTSLGIVFECHWSTVLCAFICKVKYLNARLRTPFCISRGFDLLACSRKRNQSILDNKNMKLAAFLANFPYSIPRKHFSNLKPLFKLHFCRVFRFSTLQRKLNLKASETQATYFHAYYLNPASFSVLIN